MQALQNILVLQTVAAQTQIADISYKLIHPGAYQLISLFIPDIPEREQVLNHGCWCAKLNPDSIGNLIHLGGREPTDETDYTCLFWAENRHCCRLEGGPCFNELEDVTYQVEYRNFEKTCKNVYSLKLEHF